MKKFTPQIFVCSLLMITMAATTAAAIPQEQKEDLQRYANMWLQKAYEAKQRRDRLFPNGIPGKGSSRFDEYVLLSRTIRKSKQTAQYYLDGARVQDGNIVILKQTMLNSAEDVSNMAAIMWDNMKIIQMFDKSWTDLLSDAYDAFFQNKIRSMIRDTMGCDDPVSDFEKHLMRMVTPTVKKSAAWKKMEEGSDKGIKLLKDKYKAELKRQFTQRWRKKTKGLSRETARKMGEKFAESTMKQVTGAIDAVTFTAGIMQKVYFWNEYSSTIQQTVNEVSLRKQKYHAAGSDISCQDAYDVWAGKKKLPLPSANGNTAASGSPGSPAPGDIQQTPGGTSTQIDDASHNNRNDSTTGGGVSDEASAAFQEFQDLNALYNKLPAGDKKQLIGKQRDVAYKKWTEAMKK